SFHRAISLASQAAGAGRLTTFGIIPDAPETGYGYINRGQTLPRLESTFAIERFVEKPDLPTAQRMVASGQYYWNSGMFMLKAANFLDELKQYQPAIVAAVQAALDGAVADMDFCRLDRTAFAASPSISIDYAVMEKTRNGAVIPVTMGWNDVGSWDALWEVQDKDDQGNVFSGDIVAAKVSNS
ncbi:MAG: mannose-1-phosphate guanylyltransferase/mannose-6-phosphate isomerase, partial [Pseudomonadales bacterium]|nr:mannose-1-phosphate guanylyltransferase/mannose-6-phosphate isomerase [Pseudomonadales bacterium]